MMYFSKSGWRHTPSSLFFTSFLLCLASEFFGSEKVFLTFSTPFNNLSLYFKLKFSGDTTCSGRVKYHLPYIHVFLADIALPSTVTKVNNFQ